MFEYTHHTASRNRGNLSIAAVLVAAWVGGPSLSVAQTCSGTRTLPPNYPPAMPVSVAIAVQPDVATEVYAVEDTPPLEWMVSDISDGGVFDAKTGKVKWGLFLDNLARTLTYAVTSPAGQTGQQCFGPGVVSCDGVDQTIGGDACIKPPAVPTVSLWGLVVATLLVLTAGTILIDTRQWLAVGTALSGGPPHRSR